MSGAKMKLEDYMPHDYMKLSNAEFWKCVDRGADAARETVIALFDKVDGTPIHKVEAVQGLDALFIDSHRRIRDYSSKLARYYPTKQFTNNRLSTKDELWWIDHYTTGISKWSTLSWFSAKKNLRKGKRRYNGASTHFVLGYEGYPFYIIPLVHGAWHTPARNADSISIEMVNAGTVKKHKGKWCYWPKDYTQPLPEQLVVDLPPTRLPQKFRGAQVMQPFTASQIRYNILLKRIVCAALPGKINPVRFSQHQEWQKGKRDMGPLWPFNDVNSAVQDCFAIKQYSFLSKFELAVQDGVLSEIEAEDLRIQEQLTADSPHPEASNPEYGYEEPTYEKDLESTPEKLLTTREVQEFLNRCGIRVLMDGKFGLMTKKAVIKFQMRYNSTHSDTAHLVVDGIPGPATCKALKETEKE
jgi:N-acetyl-anhydromuramyl-L-alanine amidase AmpD